MFNGLIIWFSDSEGQQIGRLSGLFNHANIAGAWLALVWPFALATVLQTSLHFSKRTIAFLGLLSISIALILTNSRNAWGGLFLSVPLVLGLGTWHWLIPLLLIILLPVALAVFPFIPLEIQVLSRRIVPEGLWLRLSDIQFAAQRPLEATRLFQWKEAIALFVAKPWFGYGAAAFSVLYPLRQGIWHGHTHNLPLEFQIRTQEMDQLAQSGIAAHWLYKTTSSISKLSREQQWLNNLLDIQKQSGNPTEFLGSIKDDLNPGKVYVFSSKGEIIELPKKSTLIDFAYTIHTDLGNKYSSGKVDGEFKPPNTILKNGQRVVIEKSEIAKPDPSWLNFVTSVKARTSIRNYLRSIHESDAQKLGEKLLMSSLNEMEVSLNDVPSKTLNFILSEYKFKTIEELYVEIGLGNVIPKLIALRMAPSFKQDTSKTIYDIEGSEGLVMSYAKCCHPIPGDTIVGHITQGKGIVVHRSSCKSIRHIKRDKDNIELISKFRHMYEISGISMRWVEFFLDNFGIVEDYWKDVLNEKTKLHYMLRNFEIIDSNCNWIHFNTEDDNKKTIEVFAKHKVLVKYCEVPHDDRKNWCRLTIKPGICDEPFIQELIDAY